MQVGDKVVCISRDLKYISYGKIYDTIGIYSSYFTISNNGIGMNSMYCYNEFRLLSEYRNELIEDICK